MIGVLNRPGFIKAFMCVVLFFELGHVKAQTCIADFLYSYLDSTTIHIYNHSTQYDSAIWTITDGVVVSESMQALVVSVPSGETRVCLRIISLDDCNDEICMDIYPGSEGDICSVTDCVWPGDANGDRIANNYDLLHIGVGYGTQGPGRTYSPVPDDPLAWTPSHAENWEQWVGVVNYKHMDCDGNGVIDASDVEAIIKNYTPDQSFVPDDYPGAPPIELVLDEDVIVIEQNNRPDSIVITGSVQVGSSVKPMDELYGLAFSFTYDTSQVRSGTARFSKIGGSFLGQTEEIFDLSTNLDGTHLSGRADYAISRNTQQGTSGFGAVATFSLVIEGDIIGGRDINDINLKISKIKAVDSLGNNLPFDLINGDITVVVVEDNITSSQDLDDQSAAVLFPNPAKDIFQFKSVNRNWAWLEVINIQGQRIKTQVITSDTEVISLSGIPDGTYWVKAWDRDGKWISKMMVVQ